MSLGLDATPGATHHDEQETLGVPLLEVGTALGHQNSEAGETEAFVVRQALLEVLRWQNQGNDPGEAPLQRIQEIAHVSVCILDPAMPFVIPWVSD